MSLLTIKGFATHAGFTNNTPGAVHPIGEISAHSLTYARDRGLYAKQTPNAITLHTFCTKSDNNPIIINPTDRDQTMAVIDWIYTRVLNAGGPIYADELLTQLLTQFQTKCSQFECGAVITDGQSYIPTWVSWKFNNQDSFVKIWFSDPNFQTEYDEYEIVVLPPLQPLDLFFQHHNQVIDGLNAITQTKIVKQIADARDDAPETLPRVEEFEYISPLNPIVRKMTSWTVLIYGQAGNNIDSIKDAIIAYVLANTARTRDEWVKIMPDLFKRTEFMLLAMWENIAIQNRTVDIGINSPVVKLTDAKKWIVDNAPDYKLEHINIHAGVMAHPYKSITIPYIGSADNKEMKFDIKDFYPDYIAVASTSTDFNRMSAKTREWAEILFNMLVVADSATRFSSLPPEFTKLKRGNLWFVVRSHMNVHFLVPMRSNYDEKPQ